MVYSYSGSFVGVRRGRVQPWFSERSRSCPRSGEAQAHRQHRIGKTVCAGDLEGINDSQRWIADRGNMKHSAFGTLMNLRSRTNIENSLELC